ncbi:5-deoxy-glucuronate isomerase [Alloiococcus sp. CFN-8]|uniref:5-deoxy-glucuronate isomerase n=1 Tax=Alloiococcus sp. CFN-8 TaxID=3416081 RepID=UPI003CFA2E2A
MNNENVDRLKKWKFNSSEEPGFHEVIVPGKADCSAIHIYRLNLLAGQAYTLEAKNLEMNAVLISGKATISGNPLLDTTMDKFDAFYIPAENSVKIEAIGDCIFYIAGAEYSGIGEASFRKFDISLPIGDIHQIHGSGAGQREVMFTLDPKTPASRLICGLTWGGTGTWTSWPPHQHEKDLEEAYCYFDMPYPEFGLHLSYLKSGEVEDVVAHVVHSGTMILAPRGYHPTVASPSTRNAYFWALAAFTPESRSYDLAVLDPMYE